MDIYKRSLVPSVVGLGIALGLGLTRLALAGEKPAPAGEKPAPLSHDEIKAVVDSHLDDVKGCMKDHGAATGKLVVQFGILPNGKVIDNKPKDHSSNAALDSCIAKKFASFVFPKLRGNVVMGVVYPFTFSAPPPPPPEGKLEPTQVAATVHGKQAEVDACYAEARKEKADLVGVVRVALVISALGVVTESKMHENTTGSAKLESCLVTHSKTWQFPKPAGNGEAAIIYPFIFVDSKKK